MHGVGCSRDHRDYEDQVPRHTHLGRKEKGYGSLEARRKELPFQSPEGRKRDEFMRGGSLA